MYVLGLNMLVGFIGGVVLTVICGVNMGHRRYWAGRRDSAARIRDEIREYITLQCGDRVREGHPKWELRKLAARGGTLDSVCRHFADHQVGYPGRHGGVARTYATADGLTDEERRAGTHRVSTARIRPGVWDGFPSDDTTRVVRDFTDEG